MGLHEVKMTPEKVDAYIASRITAGCCHLRTSDVVQETFQRIALQTSPAFLPPKSLGSESAPRSPR